MAVQPGVWGIDLGQCALKAIRLELQDGQATATAFDYVEHPKILSQPDADADQLTREALEKFLSRNSLKGDSVAISVPGQSGLARFVKLPPVEEKKIGDIVKFEAKQQIPFNLDEVVWDYQKVSSGLVTDGFALETEIGLFAMKRDMVSRYLQHFKDVNVEVHVVQMAPLCLCNYVAYDLLNVGADAPPDEGGGKKRCVVALDIGADSSNLVVTDGRRIIWQRPIPLGGNHFTRALTKDLKLTFAKAEHLKRNATKSGPELKKILTALKPVLNDFAGEVQRSLGYFTNTHREAQVEYMVGLGSAFRLPGLQRFLSEKMQLEVRKLQKLERLAGDSVVTAPAFTENVLSFAVAYGLAIQGLHVARLHTNLLPPEIRTERLVRAKKPWAAAAAAALLLGTAGLAWSYALEYRSVNIDAEPLKGAKKASDDTFAEYDRKKKDFDKEEDETKKEEVGVKSIVAGQEEKLNWVRLNKFLADALPRPDGTNLPPEARPYFDEQAQQAQLSYKKMIDHPKQGQRLDTSAIDRDLVQFNIEALDARWTDDLNAYWTKVKTTVGEKSKVRPASDWDNMPKEKEAGWVVELRGYTYNRNGPGFVLTGLVQRLADAGAAPAAAPAADGKPAPAAAPGGAPPAGGDAAKPESKEPVVGRVSHVVLYKSINVTPDSSADLLGSSLVAGLFGGSSSPTGMGGGGMGGSGGMPASPTGGMPSGAGGGAGASGGTPGAPGAGAAGGAGGENRGSFKPLIGSTAAAGGVQGLPGGLPGGGIVGGAPGGGRPVVPPQGGSNMGGGTGGVPAPGKTDDAGKPSAQIGRTEFVIFFIWREPTPSDALRPVTVISTEAAAPAGMPSGAPSGMPSGMGAGGATGGMGGKPAADKE